MSLDWSDNAEGDLAGYYVYRSTTSGGTYTRLNSTLLTSSNYTDNTVTNGTTYYYVVTAADNSSNESDNSNEVSAAPYADMTPPAAPTGLSAAAGKHTVLLDWNNNSETDMAGYNVYRSTTSGSGYSKLNSSLLTSSNYTDNSASIGMTYYYVVEQWIFIQMNPQTQARSRPYRALKHLYLRRYNAANTNYNAYACDVDVFPFAGNSGNRNSQVEATDAQYVKIATNNTTEWTTVNPGTSDEIFIWIEMKVNEALPLSAELT